MPQKQKTADEIIAEAKAAYKTAGGGQHEYSNAKYNMARKPVEKPIPATKPITKPVVKTEQPTGVKKEAADAGSGIAYRLKQQKALETK